MSIEIVSFTAQGAHLAAQLCTALPDAVAYALPRDCTEPLHPLQQPLSDWTAQRFLPGSALVFIGAAGIAVRAIAPYIVSKGSDPAVLCIDHSGHFVIPLLSGHLGGANRLAKQIAQIIGAQAVLTTATDRSGVFSPDAWAAENNCAVADLSQIKFVSAALLRSEPVGFVSDFPLGSPLPDGVLPGTGAGCGIEITLQPNHPFPHTLHLIPRCVVAGIGCRRGVDASVLLHRLTAALEEARLPLQAVGAIASIDLKADERGLLTLCEQLRVPLLTYSSEQLMQITGDFTVSERVARITGADNVCERAAALAGGQLITRKSAGQGVTVALAQRPFPIVFEGATK